MPIPINSPLRLLNDSVCREQDWWEWTLWVEGPDADLDQVASVTYKLHPSFPQPIQIVRERSTKFRLHGSGWGEFMVTAGVELRSGEAIALERWLELRDAAGNRLSDTAGAGGHRPTVFISSSAMDSDFVDLLSTALRDQGIEPLRAEDLMQSNISAFATVNNALKESDGLIAVFSAPRSSWVETEFARGKELSKRLFPVVLGDTPPPPVLSGIAHYELKERNNVAGLANTIAAQLKDQLIPE